MIENPGDLPAKREPRFYMWLDDFQSCSPGSYEIGDSLIRCSEDCDGREYDTDHSVKSISYLSTRRHDMTYEEVKAKNDTVEEEAKQTLEDMNGWWDAQTKDSLGIELADAQEKLDSTNNTLSATEHYLSEAVGLIVRFYWEHIMDQPDLEIDGDISRFWNYMTKKAMPDEVMGIAYDAGLPLDPVRRKQVWEKRRISKEKQAELERLENERMMEAFKRR